MTDEPVADNSANLHPATKSYERDAHLIKRAIREKAIEGDTTAMLAFAVHEMDRTIFESLGSITEALDNLDRIEEHLAAIVKLMGGRVRP